MNFLAAGIGRTGLLGNCVAAVLLCGSAASVGAVTSSGMFAVTATFVSAGNPTQPKSAFCHTTSALAFGALVTVVCATGAVVSVAPPASAAPDVPTFGRAYQGIVSRTFSPVLSNFMESSAGFGVASSWRLVQVGDRSYYELQMGW